MSERKTQCHECQLKAGAKPPKHNPELRGVTCIVGTCPSCGKGPQALMYACDYDWPKTGERAVYD